MRTLFFVVALSSLAWPQTTKQLYKVQPAPKLPFFDWNACPFEGIRLSNAFCSSSAFNVALEL